MIRHGMHLQSWRQHLCVRAVLPLTLLWFHLPVLVVSHNARLSLWAPAMHLAFTVILIQAMQRDVLTYGWKDNYLWVCYKANLSEATRFSGSNERCPMGVGRMAQVKHCVLESNRDLVMAMAQNGTNAKKKMLSKLKDIEMLAREVVARMHRASGVAAAKLANDAGEAEVNEVNVLAAALLPSLPQLPRAEVTTTCWSRHGRVVNEEDHSMVSDEKVAGLQRQLLEIRKGVHQLQQQLYLQQQCHLRAERYWNNLAECILQVFQVPALVGRGDAHCTSSKHSGA